MKQLRAFDTDTDMPVDLTVLHGEDWSALYVDGELEYAGDTYLIWEHLMSMFGATDESVDPSELLFPDGRNPGSLADVRAREAEYDARQAEAEELERDAERLQRRTAVVRELAQRAVKGADHG